jgi:hypothetical protein
MRGGDSHSALILSRYPLAIGTPSMRYHPLHARLIRRRRHSQDRSTSRST